jgi:T-complex protein 1 subunit alpha
MQGGGQKTQRALGINGTRVTGQDVRKENVTAALAVANIIKTSLGPVGLDKMLVDEVGEVVVTNDGATILKKLDIEHPAGRMLVDLAKLQDDEVGDGTTSVVVLAAELLRRAENLIRQNIHATNIIAGYKLAAREAVRAIQENLAVPCNPSDRALLLNIARTSLSSKILGHTDPETFSNIVVDAVLSVAVTDEVSGDVRYPRKAIGILKQHGKSLNESALVKGYALNCTRASQGMPSRVSPAKIALLDFDLRAVKLRLGVSATLTDPTKAEDMKKREMDITRERVRKIIAAGANVILTTCGIDDAIQKLMVEAGVMGVRRVLKDDLRRIARVTKASIQTTLCDLNGEEVFDASSLGLAESCGEERFSDDECIIIRGTAGGIASSIILRGASSFLLDEADRAMNDALCALGRALEVGSVVAGGGAVEGFLSAHLEGFAHTLGSREQLAIAEFAQAMLVIPKQLALNSALDASDLVARLRVDHCSALNPGADPALKYSGLDLQEGVIRNNLAAGVVEPRTSKVKSIQFATEASITILRIDDCVRLNPPPEPEDPRGGMH